MLGTSEEVSRLISETGEGTWTRTSDRVLRDGVEIQVILAVLFRLAVIWGLIDGPADFRVILS